MESGKEQRRSKGLPRRKFTLKFDKTTNYNDDAQEIWDFFRARKGRFEKFLWDYKKADGSVEEVTVRFDEDNLSREAFLTKAYSFGLTLIEVI
jgi:phage-related protein